MGNLKACILAAGEGKRLAPITETRPKPLIPIGGKPLLEHIINDLKNNDVKEILLIVGYRKEQIKEYFKDGVDLGVHISYQIQTEFLGTGHATNLAKDFVGEDPFLLIYGDLFMDSGIITESINLFRNSSFDGLLTAKPMPDPSKWGIMKITEENFLEQIIEKPPDNRFGNLANTGIYIFTPAIFKDISQTEKSSRGEYELTDAIEAGIHLGKQYKVLDVGKYYWSDVGHPWQLLDATQHVMELLPGEMVSKSYLPPSNIINHGGIIEDFVTIHGTVILEEGVVIKSGTYIEGPVIIGKNSQIGPNSYLRPFTTIGKDCKIGNASEIKASIIMDKTAIPHLSYVGDSIIGENVNFGCGSITANLRLDKSMIPMIIKEQKISTHRKKLGTIIGDNVQLGIQVSIMPGITIGSNSYIGSNTIVRKNVPPNSTYFDSPSSSLKNH